MSSLENLQINDTFPGLIKTNDEAAIDGTLRTLQDGAGNNLPMQVSTTGVNFTGTVTGIPVGGVQSIIAGTNITVDDTDPFNPIVSASGGGGGGGIEPLAIMSNQNYGPVWDYYSPTGGPGAYGRRLIGYTSYLPAGTYDQFNHWVRTGATTEGAVYDMAIYNTTNVWAFQSALSLKPTTLVTNAIVTGVDATTTGQKLITVGTPFTVTGGWYFFAFRFDNGVNNEMEGSYAGSKTADQKFTYNAGLGFPTPYIFASTWLQNDALIVGSVGEYTSMPEDLTAETYFQNTSYRLAFSVVAQ